MTKQNTRVRRAPHRPKTRVIHLDRADRPQPAAPERHLRYDAYTSAQEGVIVVHIRRSIGDAFISIGAVTMLLAVLVSVDDRVRQQVSLRFSSGAAQEQLRDAGVQMRDLVTVIADAAQHQSIEHAPMMMLVLAGAVLFVFMLRT